MKSAALLTVALVATSYVATAKPYHGHRHGPRAIHHANTSSDRESRSGITCDMVRAYVAQVCVSCCRCRWVRAGGGGWGLPKAVAMAQSGGITSSERARARRCLAEK